jgi:hypothetical protein
MKGLSPGVLTPGLDEKTARPEGAAGWRVVYLTPSKNLGITTCRPYRANRRFWTCLGLKPQAESFHPFGVIQTDLRAQEATRSGSAHCPFRALPLSSRTPPTPRICAGSAADGVQLGLAAGESAILWKLR